MIAFLFDPLVCDWHHVWRYRSRDEDCDCCAPPCAHHAESCSITPIYAQLIGERGSVRTISHEIVGYAMQYMRTERK